jgi:thiol-disulfide isomerase/thioredoxin
MMMKKNLVLVVLVGLVFGGVGMFVGSRAPIGKPADAAANAPAAGSPAASAPAAVQSLFAQSMADSAGGMQKLAQWQGKPVVVNFWATWCGPCVQEMPELSALQTELAPRHIQIVGIGIDSPTNIREFATKYKIAYPLYVAGMSGTDLSKQFGNQAGGLPYTVLIGANGQIVKTYLGKLKMEELRKDLAAL